MKKSYIIHLIVVIFIILNIINLKNLSLIDWDEGTFALQAKWLASMGLDGKPFNFQTPPLFQIIIAILFKILGCQDWILPFISIVFSAIILYIIFLLGKELYNETIGLLAVVIFISTEYFLFFSKSGLSDAIFLFFFITAIYFFNRSLEKKHNIYYLYCGIFTLLACYTKYTGPILFLIFLIIGINRRKQLNKYWLLFTIVIPILLLLPYLLIFIRIITIPGITQRYGKLLGINHLKFLYYLIRFAPLIFITAIFYRMKSKTDHFILIIIVIFFFVLGFYYPYFRLAFPLIPLFSLFSAGFLYQFKKLRYYLLGLIFLLNIFLGFNTITYHSNIPPSIGQKVESLCKLYNTNYVFALTPPNMVFYLDGSILQSDTHVPVRLTNIGYLKGSGFLKIGDNLLKNQKRVLFVYSSIFEDFEKKFKPLKSMANLTDSIEFIDAPIYDKDLFNPLRSKKQIYEIYLFEIEKLDTLSLNNLWEIGLLRGSTVIRK